MFRKYCLYFSLLSVIYITPVLADTNFYVDPTRIILQDNHNSVPLNVHNNASESQLVQVKLKMIVQAEKKGYIVESNPEIMGDPQVVVTPQVLNISPNSSKPIRLLALSQMDNDEIAYRLFVSSVSRRQVTSSGTQMELGFGVPVYVLPKNIVQKASYSIKHSTNGQYLITITNTGNVHLNVNKVVLFDNSKKAIQTVETPGAILSGKSRTFKFSLNKAYQSYKQFKAEVKSQNLISYTDEITTATTIDVN